MKKDVTIIRSALVRMARTNMNKAKIAARTEKDTNGIIIHGIQSDYQNGETQIKVLLPDDVKNGKKYRVIYILPAEPGNNTQFGDGLLEAKKMGINNLDGGVICVYPTFSNWPWYADHPTDKKIRQESYFLNAAIPFIENEYPCINGFGGRFLIGFSKSGWGAYSLLLRHPDMFSKAAAWDSPFFMEKIGNWGTSDIFGDNYNFNKYKIPFLISQKADLFKDKRCLVLMGYGLFKDHVNKMHELMLSSKISHDYEQEPERKHRWDSGWLETAVKFLLEIK